MARFSVSEYDSQYLCMLISWLKDRQTYLRMKAWTARYERVLVSTFLFGGFLLHYFTFRSLDVGITLVGLGIYLLLAALCIVAISYDEKHALSAGGHLWFARMRLAAPMILQIAFGSLLSMAFLFYWFSGSTSVSWPIFLLLAGLTFFNEKFRHAYLQPWVQVTLFSFVLFVYVTVLFPYLFNSLAPWVFLLGGGMSLMISLLLVWQMVSLASTLRRHLWQMVTSVVGISVALIVLYFTNLIPPIPLSLRDAGVYHDVHREGDTYVLTGEPETWLQRWLPGSVLHLDAAGRVYVYTSIYSPTNLDIMIFHEWEHYNEDQKKWETVSRLSFPITGGRRDGYRGYTFKTNLALGRWRVNVETVRGQTLGRIGFILVK